MTKYRIWKYGGAISYKDVEADSLEEADKTYTSPEEDWTATDRGMIIDYFTTTDLENDNGSELFLQRTVRETKDAIERLNDK